MWIRCLIRHRQTVVSQRARELSLVAIRPCNPKPAPGPNTIISRVCILWCLRWVWCHPRSLPSVVQAWVSLPSEGPNRSIAERPEEPAGSSAPVVPAKNSNLLAYSVRSVSLRSNAGIRCHGKCEADPKDPVPVAAAASLVCAACSDMTIGSYGPWSAPFQDKEDFLILTCTDCNIVLGSSRLRYQCELITLVGTLRSCPGNPMALKGPHPIKENSSPEPQRCWSTNNQRFHQSHHYGSKWSERPLRPDGLKAFSSDTRAA